jgi:hypothetical protein
VEASLPSAIEAARHRSVCAARPAGSLLQRAPSGITLIFGQNTKPNRDRGFLSIAMSRYYFNVYNDEVTLDEEGAELADTPAALRRAADEARNFAAESVKARGHLVLHHKIEVEDEGRNKVGVVYFRDVVAIEP